MCLVKATKARKLDTCQSNLRKRASETREFIEQEAGCSTSSIAKLTAKVVKRSSKEERALILDEMGLKSNEIDASDGLALLADTKSSWYKYKVWGRLVLSLCTYNCF